MNKVRMFILAAFLACSATFFVGCEDNASQPVDNPSNQPVSVDAEDSQGGEDDKPEPKPEEAEKPLTINEYSLGIYPYYKDVMTTYYCRKINKDMIVDGKSVIVKDVLKLTVGFTNSGSLPLAYLWSQKPPIKVHVDGVKDVSGYPDEIGSTYNVLYIMPGESITYDFILKPEDADRVIYRGKSEITFMPIADDSIIDNPDYDLNDIFMPVLGAKNYTNYMVHTSQEFEIDKKDCKITFIDREPANISADRIRHDYYSVNSTVMDMIRSNGYALNNVTPVYGLRYDLSNGEGAQDFIDDIDANISIENNLQHSKNQYFGLMDGKSVLYVPDINRLTKIADDGGRCYDLNISSKEMLAVLNRSRLNLEETTAKFVSTDGYIDFILLSDGNYEYIKAVKDYPEFGVVANKLYTPKELSQNIVINADKLKSSPKKGISQEMEDKLIDCVKETISAYGEKERNESLFVTPPEGITFPETLDSSELSFDINSESGRSVVSLPLYSGEDLYTMLIIVGNSLDKPEIEAVAFIEGEKESSTDALPIYDAQKLLESINAMAERYSKDDAPESDSYDILPEGVKFRKLTSIDDVKIKIDDDDIKRATVTVPLNEEGSVIAKVRIRDISGACKVVGVRFVNE